MGEGAQADLRGGVCGVVVEVVVSLDIVVKMGVVIGMVVVEGLMVQAVAAVAGFPLQSVASPPMAKMVSFMRIKLC